MALGQSKVDAKSEGAANEILALGKKAIESHDWTKAIEQLSVVLEMAAKDKTVIECLYFRGMAYHRLDSCDRAKEDLEIMLDMVGNSEYGSMIENTHSLLAKCPDSSWIPTPQIAEEPKVERQISQPMKRAPLSSRGIRISLQAGKSQLQSDYSSEDFVGFVGGLLFAVGRFDLGCTLGFQFFETEKEIDDPDIHDEPVIVRRTIDLMILTTDLRILVLDESALKLHLRGGLGITSVGQWVDHLPLSDPLDIEKSKIGLAGIGGLGVEIVLSSHFSIPIEFGYGMTDIGDDIDGEQMNLNWIFVSAGINIGL